VATTVDSLAAARAWLAANSERAVMPHGDADGLAAGPALGRVAHGGVLPVETPWGRRLEAGGIS
jgi:hypothetical protein